MMLTYAKGIQFDYENFTESNVNKGDIFLSLSRINRFIGHTSKPYSVGEHTINCYKMAKKLKYNHREQLLVFIHDWTEAYVGDCVTDLKSMMPKFAEVEESVEMAICKYLGIEPPTKEEHKKVKLVDYTMMLIEMRNLTKHKWMELINDNTVVDMFYDDDFKYFEKVDEMDVICELDYIFDDLVHYNGLVINNGKN